MAAVLAAPPVLPEPAPSEPAPLAIAPVDLRWDAPAGCPNEAEVRAAMEAYSAAEPGSGVRAEASVAAEGDEFELALRVEDGPRTETRSLRSRDCGALARAAALVIAVARDPLGVARRISETETAEPETEPRPATQTTPASQPMAPPIAAPAADASASPAAPDRSRRTSKSPADDRRRERARPPLRIALRPELQLGGGLLPGAIGAAVAGTVAVIGRARPWRAELGGAYWFPRTATVDDDPSAGGRLWLALASGSGCGVPSVGRLEFPLCAGADLGAVGGEGFGSRVNERRSSDLWAGAHGSAGLSWAPIDALALVAQVEGVISLRRPGFRLDGVGGVHRVGPGGARGAIGLEVRFF